MIVPRLHPKNKKSDGTNVKIPRVLKERFIRRPIKPISRDWIQYCDLVIKSLKRKEIKVKKLCDTSQSHQIEVFQNIVERIGKRFPEILDEQSRITGHSIYYQGNFTVCLLYGDAGGFSGVIGVGVTKRDPNMDINNPNLGYSIAVSRALKNFLERS